VESKVLKIEIPDEPLTASDLVGRAIRIARLNWLPMIRFQIVPMIVYWAAFFCMCWDPDTYDRNFPANVSFWIITLGLIVNYLSIWELAIRKFALLLFLANAAETLEEALRKAQKKMWMILFLAQPVFFTEASLDVLSFVSSKIGKVASGGDLHSPLMLMSVFLSAVEFAFLLPFIWIIVLNLFYLTILVFEKTSLKQAFVRFCTLLYQDKGYAFVYSTVMACIFFATIAPTLVAVPLELILPQNALKYLIIAVASSILIVPIDTFLNVAVTIGGALLYKQVCARLEGQDLLDKLKRIESK